MFYYLQIIFHFILIICKFILHGNGSLSGVKRRARIGGTGDGVLIALVKVFYLRGEFKCCVGGQRE